MPSFVSVMIPSYNHGEFIEEANNSILSQSYQDIEIIVVNNGSDDKQTLKLKKISINQKQTSTPKNGGPSSARNNGIKKNLIEFNLTLNSDGQV